MRDLPEGYFLSLGEVGDIPALIAVDKAASALFAPTGLVESEALDDHVPAEIFEQAMAVGDVVAAYNRHGWPVGFAIFSVRGNGLYLDQVSVHPDHGKQGLGRILVYAVIAEAEARRLSHVSLSTFRDLRWNGPFYASMGFVEMDRSDMEPYMLEIEDAQRGHMDVSARCFMRRKVRGSLMRLVMPWRTSS
ncbi:MAG: GNAT family N-acetyltransferase [Pseudomonadota bacterium]